MAQSRMRDVTTDDIWAAARGLGMFSKSKAELLEIAEQHKSESLFASCVIRAAALQVAATKRD
jgi:hypothetical protein